MHNWKFWAGVVLFLIAFLPTVSFVISPALVFTGPLLVLLAFLGGYLLAGAMGMSKGWKLWTGLILFLLAFLPAVGITIIPALVFTGPLLVIVALLGGYLLARPHHGGPI